MTATKSYQIFKNDGEGNETPAGGVISASNEELAQDKVNRQKQIFRANQPAGSSAWFIVRAV